MRSRTASASAIYSLDFESLFAAWRAADAGRAAGFFAPDGLYQEARRDPLVGREAIAAHWESFFRAGPAWQFEVEEIFGDAAGSRYAIRYVFHMEMKDGGRQARPGCALVHVRDGLISLWREYSG